MEKWHEDNHTDNVCEYAETALEHYMKDNSNLKEENLKLKEHIKELLGMVKQND